MFLHIQNVLTAEEIAFFQQHLGPDAPWVDGARSAGGQAQHQKNNLQLSQATELAAQLQAKVKAAVHRSALFFSAALPRRIFNPLFNNYGDSANYYGNHVDSAVMHSKADGCWVRSRHWGQRAQAHRYQEGLKRHCVSSVAQLCCRATVILHNIEMPDNMFYK